MTRLVSTLSLLLFLSLLAAPAAADHHKKKGFTNLVQGNTLKGWWGQGTKNPVSYLSLPADKLAEMKKKSLDNIKQHWKVEDGVVINDGKGLYLTTDKNYGDFEFLIDYKTVAKADSGIYLRGVPQVQIWDYTKEGGKWKIGADKGSGGLWNNSKGAPGKDPLVLADKPFGQWNRFRIVMTGSHVTIWLNDKLVVDHAVLENYFDRKGGLPAKGPIQLQTHGGEISWRNILIREIGKEESANILRAGGAAKFFGKKSSADANPSNDEGYTTIFNGKDFAGWKGPTQNYEVTAEGTLKCKKGKGGTIYTVDTFDDFSVRFEFKLPPGGNNGLAIRYPGSGDTAYAGMCELQVLDNTAKKYAKLDPRQYHGSVYGQWPAKRGHLKKPGEWNQQEVTVKGHHIKVTLNGTVILDKDISTIKEFMAKPEKFKGRLRTSGHFGFAGHSDPVEFRNVRIKRLK